MSVLDSAKEWLFSIAVKKVVQNIAKVAISAAGVWLAAHQADLAKYGINLNLDTSVALAGTVGAAELLRNWLKVKYNLTWL